MFFEIKDVLGRSVYLNLAHVTHFEAVENGTELFLTVFVGQTKVFEGGVEPSVVDQMAQVKVALHG